EIAVFAPTNPRVDRVYARLVAAGIPARRLHEADRKDGTARVSVGTMHRAKGLEYRAVFAVDVSEGIVNPPTSESETPDPRDPARFGDARGGRLLRDAARLTVRNGAGPFRSFARIAVEPRPYQLVPLLMALRLDTVRLLIADADVIGKTVEAGLVARELYDR